MVEKKYLSEKFLKTFLTNTDSTGRTRVGTMINISIAVIFGTALAINNIINE